MELTTDPVMGVKVLGINVRIGGRDVAITIEEARILLCELQDVLTSPIGHEEHCK